MRKIFTFLFAALMSVGMWALTPKSGDTWDETTKTLTVNSNPEDYAYWGESDIENLVISDAVTSIGVSAFEECSALTSVTIGNSVTSIGTSAFSSCYLLTSVEIPNSVEEIGVQAFASCSELTSVTIGNGVTSIGDYAFVDCSGLETVMINAESLESYGTDAFEGTAEDLTIYVPAGSVDTYKAGWAAYANKIEAIPDPTPATVAVTGVTLNQNEAQMTVGGETLTLTATVNPNNATDQSVSWSTNDANVATVENGVVTAVAAGNATITVTTNDGSFTATCAVTVSNPAPAATVVTITDSDFPAWGESCTKDGVTISAEMIDGMYGNISGPGSFSTTLGNFTKIEVNAMDVNISGEGWSGNSEKMTWTGNASSVSFTGDINGDEEGVTLKFTIEEGGTTAVENVQTNHVQTTKFFRDGQLLIEKNGKIYNVMGAEVK